MEPKGIHPPTAQVIQGKSINLEGQYSKSVSEYLGKADFGYLITACDHTDKNCPTTFLGTSHRLHWGFEDPASFEGGPEETLQKFRQVRDQIEAEIIKWLKEQVN